jgi:hypothetical protein
VEAEGTSAKYCLLARSRACVSKAFHVNLHEADVIESEIVDHLGLDFDGIRVETRICRFFQAEVRQSEPLSRIVR